MNGHANCVSIGDRFYILRCVFFTMNFYLFFPLLPFSLPLIPSPPSPSVLPEFCVYLVGWVHPEPRKASCVLGCTPLRPGLFLNLLFPPGLEASKPQAFSVSMSSRAGIYGHVGDTPLVTGVLGSELWSSGLHRTRS